MRTDNFEHPKNEYDIKIQNNSNNRIVKIESRSSLTYKRTLIQAINDLDIIGPYISSAKPKETYVDYYGCLWAVFNEDSKHKRALGMHKGASDLHLFINGRFAVIELKAPKAVHSVKHLKKQIEYGKNIIKNGGLFYIGSNISEIKQFIIDIILNSHSQIDTLKYLEKQIKLGKKTIMF